MSEPRSVDCRNSRRLFGWASTIGIAIAGGVFSWMVTGGTWNFLGSLPFSSFYDVQARSLLRGTWSMPASVLSIEGIRTGNRTDMYYGPVPSFLRMPVLLFTHRLDGRLTEISLLIGFLVALLFVSLLSWRLRCMIRGPVPVGRLEAVLTAGFVVLIGLGSVLLFLASTAQVYEEAEMWGAAFALGAFYTLLCVLHRPSGTNVTATGVLVTLAMLTRGSVGGGPLLAVGLVAAVFLFAWAGHHIARLRPLGQSLANLCGVQTGTRPGRVAGGLGVAFVIPVALYAAINEVKFGSLFNIPVNRQVYSLESAHRKAVLAANGGSLFGTKFIPTNLLQYLRPDALSITHPFPWLFFPGKATILGHLLYDTRDWASSVPASMPVLFLLALVGIIAAFWPARRHTPALAMAAEPAPRGRRGREPIAASGSAPLRLLLIGAAAGTAGILTIAFIAERYLADAMPLVVLGALAGWHLLGDRWHRFPRAARITTAIVLTVLALFEVWTTVSLTLFYQREVGPAITIPQRAGMVAFQEQVNRSLFGGTAPSARFVAQLPRQAQPLDLAVLNGCGGVFQFDGNAWQPVELGRGAGARRLAVTFPQSNRGQRQPLVVTGGATPQDVLAVTWVGGDRYRFSYLFDGSLSGYSKPTWYTEQPVTVAPGHPHQVQVDLNYRQGQVFVTVDGATVFSLLYPVANPKEVRLGSAPPSVPTAARFAGQIRSVPVPTPICHTLEKSRAPAVGSH